MQIQPRLLGTSTFWDLVKKDSLLGIFIFTLRRYQYFTYPPIALAKMKINCVILDTYKYFKKKLFSQDF